MTTVLITGMSGTGKSTVLAELARRGHAVVDTDEGGWIVDVPQADGSTEPLWDEPRISTLLDEHASRTLFLAGCVANQGRFCDRFHAVVPLSAPEDVMLERLATRATNDFGKGDMERRAILRDLRAVEPLLRAGAGVEIDTRAPVAEVADRLEALVREPGHQTRRARAGGPSDHGGS
jgi:adenylate kinase family enzyme